MGDLFRLRRAMPAIVFWLVLFCGLSLMEYRGGGHTPSGVFPAYFMILWPVILGWNLIEGSRLSTYMHQNHPDEWKALTYGTVGSYRWGRGVRFVFSRREISDPRLRVLRSNAATAAIIAVMVFAHFPFSRMAAHAIAKVFL